MKMTLETHTRLCAAKMTIYRYSSKMTIPNKHKWHCYWYWFSYYCNQLIVTITMSHLANLRQIVNRHISLHLHLILHWSRNSEKYLMTLWCTVSYWMWSVLTYKILQPKCLPLAEISIVIQKKLSWSFLVIFLDYFLFFYRISESIYCQTVKARAIRIIYPMYHFIFQVILG